MSEEDVCEYEEKVCPTCGSCSGMYTANSMNCLNRSPWNGLTGQRNDPSQYIPRESVLQNMREWQSWKCIKKISVQEIL